MIYIISAIKIEDLISKLKSSVKMDSFFMEECIKKSCSLLSKNLDHFRKKTQRFVIIFTRHCNRRHSRSCFMISKTFYINFNSKIMIFSFWAIMSTEDYFASKSLLFWWSSKFNVQIPFIYWEATTRAKVWHQNKISSSNVKID